MLMQVLGSSSRGNSYILQGEKTVLLLEAGLPFADVLNAIDYKREKIIGCVISHEHGDHSRYLREYLKEGVKCYMPHDLWEVYKYNTFARECREGYVQRVGDFAICPLEMVHDVQCYGYAITHKDMGTTLFVTDTEYIPHDLGEFRFDHIMIEANYGEQILLDKVSKKGYFPYYRHIVKGHLSIESAMSYLFKLDLAHCKNIVLCHLSNEHSNKIEFIDKISSAFPNINVDVAEKQSKFNFNKYIF